MKYLVDTEVWPWIQAQPERFGYHTLTLLADERTQPVAPVGCKLMGDRHQVPQREGPAPRSAR